VDKFVKRKADQNLGYSDDEAVKDERKRKWRKYDPEYISFGLIAVGTGADLPLCVVCLQTLSSDAMKPAKLMRHLTMMHLDVDSKPKEYSERQKELYFKQKSKLMSCNTVNEKALRASYLVALRIARSKKTSQLQKSSFYQQQSICEVVLGKNNNNNNRLTAFVPGQPR